MGTSRTGPAARAAGNEWRWAIVAAYMLALFTASSGPGVALPPGRNWDKVLHAGAFGVLALLSAWALTRGRLRAATWPVLLAACLVAILYGATDEFHQSFVPGRDADVFDLVADALGAFAAAGAIRAWGIIARGSK
jgi:VanZ family protein